jgi:hypothetical protein
MNGTSLYPSFPHFASQSNISIRNHQTLANKKGRTIFDSALPHGPFKKYLICPNYPSQMELIESGAEKSSWAQFEHSIEEREITSLISQLE